MLEKERITAHETTDKRAQGFIFTSQGLSAGSTTLASQVVPDSRQRNSAKVAKQVLNKVKCYKQSSNIHCLKLLLQCFHTVNQPALFSGAASSQQKLYLSVGLKNGGLDFFPMKHTKNEQVISLL